MSPENLDKVIAGIITIIGILLAFRIFRYVEEETGGGNLVHQRKKARLQKAFDDIRSISTGEEYSPEIWAVINAAAEGTLTDSEWFILTNPEYAWVRIALAQTREKRRVGKKKHHDTTDVR